MTWAVIGLKLVKIKQGAQAPFIFSARYLLCGQGFLVQSA